MYDLEIYWIRQLIVWEGQIKNKRKLFQVKYYNNIKLLLLYQLHFKTVHLDVYEFVSEQTLMKALVSR